MADMPVKIGKYDVMGLAGRGAMGAVYMAHDPFIDRQVAIKVCTLDPQEEDTQVRLTRKMFFNEAQAAGALDHANILKVYDAGEDDGQPYIVMEYVEGGETLKNHIGAGHLLSVEQTVRLIHQCARALDYAHRRGVTHRDIKPANILLTKDGDVKIGDFGVAQRLRADQTQVMGMVGSPRYMSPEQAMDQPVTGQSDLWSLGVVMYELLTGQPPFRASTFLSLVNKIIQEKPTPLREVRPELPESLERIVTSALKKAPADRYQSGAELAAELAKIFEELDRGQAEPGEEEKFQQARPLRFFNDFADEEIREVLAASRWEQYPAGARIITEGAFEQSFFIIVRGDVEIVIGDKLVGVLGKGDCVGEMGYLAKVKRTASVVARSDITVMKVESALMEWASVQCQLRFSKVFQELLVERLARTSIELAKHIP
jgi:eukaryotic-like serine/threonine-protein kinase